jgi:hypothetical protein
VEGEVEVEVEVEAGDAVRVEDRQGTSSVFAMDGHRSDVAAAMLWTVRNK